VYRHCKLTNVTRQVTHQVRPHLLWRRVHRTSVARRPSGQCDFRFDVFFSFSFSFSFPVIF